LVLNPNDRLAVTLEAQQWNQVMDVLAMGAYRVVAPLLAEILRQCKDQPPAGKDDEADLMRPQTNVVAMTQHPDNVSA
jgi:hypothetical protein